MGQHETTCLVVEDHLDTLRMMLRLLKENGYVVHGAATYREAMEVFERERCRVLICDIALPDGSGLTLMQELAPHGVRGIAISAHASHDDRQAALNAGFSVHLPKPIRFTQLLDALDKLPSK